MIDEGLHHVVGWDGGPPEDYLKAEALLRMSTNEFKKENYGGSLYLAGQAQNQIRAIQSHLSHQVDYALAPGEVPFAQPLLLKVLTRSNLRQGPSQRSKINLTLEEGTMIIGLDVGGTHTDVVLLGRAGLIRKIKVPTNQSNTEHPSAM